MKGDSVKKFFLTALVIAMMLLGPSPAYAGPWTGEAIVGTSVEGTGGGALGVVKLVSGSWQSTTTMHAEDPDPLDRDSVYAETKYRILYADPGNQFCVSFGFDDAFHSMYAGTSVCFTKGDGAGKFVTLPYTCAPFCDELDPNYAQTSYNGSKALGSGLFVEAVVCVDRSFPQPNACSQPYSESHERVPYDTDNIHP